jgi:protein-disulfide isomerase
MPAMSDPEITTNPTWETEIPHPESKNGHTVNPAEVSVHPETPLSTDEAVTDPLQTQPNPDKDFITFRRSHLYALLLPLAFIVGLSVGYLFWGRSIAGTSTAALPDTTSGAATVPETSSEQAETSSGQATSQPQTQDTQEIVRYDVPVDDDPFYGPEDAAITLIEFSDFECPFCRKWHAEVFQRLLETYPGQIRFVYRDFPLTSIHPNSFSAAEAANCAGDQGVYWPYHEQLFSMQLGLGKDAYQQYAEQLGIDMNTFNACIEDGKYKEEIQADFEYAAQLGVRSTPTFFINGIALVGAQSFEVFQQVIEKELAGEIP